MKADWEEVAAAQWSEAAVRSVLHDHAWRAMSRSARITSEVVDELSIGNMRVDVAILGRTSHGFEIKTGRDSLARLPAQVALYNECCDLCTLVIAARHLGPALAAIPDWWGVMMSTGTDRPGVSVTREPEPNPALAPAFIYERLYLVSHGLRHWPEEGDGGRS